MAGFRAELMQQQSALAGALLDLLKHVAQERSFVERLVRYHALHQGCLRKGATHLVKRRPARA